MRIVVGAVGVALAWTSVAAAPCVPGARVIGEADVVLAIEGLLRERGVSIVAATVDATTSFRGEGCGYVVAEVRRGGRRIMVWVTDADGRRVERLAEDPIAAATVIESWARSDLVSPLLARRATIPTDPGAERREYPATSTARYGLLIGADGGVSNDGAIWSAARLQGCAVVGWACIGGVIRYGFDLERTGGAAIHDTHRRGLDLTVTVGVPFTHGRFTVMPAVGIGQMAVTASRESDPSDLDMARESEQASAVHAMLGCGAGLRVARAWSLRLDVSVAIAPLATERLGDTGVDALPASARGQAWLGVGLSYGGL